jgi:hypothetical protein
MTIGGFTLQPQPSADSNGLSQRARLRAWKCVYGVACYKVMTLRLLLLMPQTASKVCGLLLRLVGLVFLPLFVLLAVVANLSLSYGGDDCLGYTVLAIRG